MQRQDDGCLEPFPIWDDVRSFDGRAFRGRIHIVTGGFPCQPFSQAGSKAGEKDSRNMWPDTIRIIQDVQPPYLLLENVSELLINPYFGTILSDLAQSGYHVRYAIISASAIGANHLRKRLWIAGIASYALKRKLEEQLSTNPNTKGLEGWLSIRQTRRQRTKGYLAQGNWWSCEPRIQRVDDGLPDRVDRIKAIGDAQVPGVVRAAWQLLGCPE